MPEHLERLHLLSVYGDKSYSVRRRLFDGSIIGRPRAFAQLKVVWYSLLHERIKVSERILSEVPIAHRVKKRIGVVCPCKTFKPLFRIIRRENECLGAGFELKVLAFTEPLGIVQVAHVRVYHAFQHVKFVRLQQHDRFGARLLGANCRCHAALFYNQPTARFYIVEVGMCECGVFTSF
jgi:hypothetical protein